MAEYYDDKNFNNIKTLANSYNDQINREIKNYKIRETFFEAGNDMHDTLYNNFESLFLKNDEIDASNDILNEFMNMCKEESFKDVMEELSRNIGDDLDLKLKKKLSIFGGIKSNKQYDNNLPESPHSLVCDFNENDIETCCLDDTENFENFKNIEIDNSDNDNDKNLSDDNYIEVNKNKINFTDEELLEKIDNLISDDISRIEDCELNVVKIIKKIKELSELFSFTLNILAKIIGKTTLSAYYNFITYPKCWNELKEKMQFIAKRIFAFIINKKAILLLHYQYPKKIKCSVKQIIILPHPKNFLNKNIHFPIDNLDRIINLPMPDNYDIENILLGNNKPGVVNLDGLEYEANDLFSNGNNISSILKKSYNFGNKDFNLSEIKDMEISSFKFSGKIDIIELCSEARKHLKEIKMRQSILAEKILGVSQKSIYTILAPRREWKKLSDKGREPYIKLRAYLDCFKNIENDLCVTMNEENVENISDNEYYDSENQLENSFYDFKINNNITNDFNELSGNSNLSNNLQYNFPQYCYQNNEKYFYNDLSKNVSQELQSTNNLYNITSQIISDVEYVVNDIKQIMQKYNINREKFASMYLKSSLKIFEKIILSPRECDFSSIDIKNCYLELKSFINKNNMVKQASSKYKKQHGSTIDVQKTSEITNNQNIKKFIFVPMKIDLNNHSSSINLKKKSPSMESDPNDVKKLKIEENTNNEKFILYSNESHPKSTDIFNNQNHFIKSYSIPHDLNCINVRKEINMNYEASTSLPAIASTFNSPPIFYQNPTYNNHIDMGHLNFIRNNINFQSNLRFLEFYKKIMSPDYLSEANLNQLEVLCLAWTYNPQPQKMFTNYMSELTMLPIHLVEIFYWKTNNLQINTENCFSNEAFRIQLRRYILESSMRKNFITITDNFFKQLFYRNQGHF